MPILEVDGVQYCQSGAINRFLARELGFAGKDSREELRIDMIGGCLEDIMRNWPFGESDVSAYIQIQNFIKITLLIYV